MTRFTVNNQPVEYLLAPATPLLWALRDASNLTGTKYGCGTGECGACMVDVDGRPVRSCTVTIGALEGSFVTTIEGLSRDRSHPVQLAFLASNVSQCGYCIPGIVMSAQALLRSNRSPSDEEIAAALDPHLCRCGIYPRLIDAVKQAARLLRGDETIDPAAAPGVTPADETLDVPVLVTPTD